MEVMKDPKQKKFPVWIVIALVACVLFIGTAAFAAVVSGIFISPGNRILIAAANTFKDLNTSDFVKDGQYTLGIEINLDDVGADYADYNGLEVNMEIGADVPSGIYALTGDVYLPMIGMDLKGEGYLDRSELVAAVPDILDTSFVYRYSENPQG